MKQLLFYAIRLRPTGAYLTTNGATRTSAQWERLEPGCFPPRLFRLPQHCRASIREHCEMRGFAEDSLEVVTLTVGELEPDSNLALSCRWQQDSDGTFETGCGQAFVLNDGTCAENNMRFCCYCGQALVEVPFEDEPEET